MIASSFQTSQKIYNQYVPQKVKLQTPITPNSNYSRGSSYQKLCQYNMLNKTNVISCEKEKSLQDNIRQLKKLIHQKECDF